MQKFLQLIFVGVLFSGCASTHLPPLDAQNYQAVPEEKRLWARAAEERMELNESGLLFRDRTLEEYLNRIMNNLITDETRERMDVQVKVLNNPYSNAFAYPDGLVYVHTGILARIENEAQLATLLAHEITHATHRHAIRERRSFRNKAALLASMQATFGTLPAIGELTSALGEIGAKAAVSGYSRGMETEADTIGLERMITAGYDPREAPKLFDHLIAEMEEDGAREPFFFGSHPKLKERKDNFRNYVTRLSAPKGRVGKKDFEKNAASAIMAASELDLKAGRFARAERGALRYIEIRPKAASGSYLLGEIYRQRAQQGDYQKAKEQFRRTVSLDGKMAEPYRAIAILYFNEGNAARAKANFEAYLQRNPRAEDRDFILQYIRQCKQEVLQ